MPWFLVYETATGRLVSQGTVLADPLPRGLTSVDVGTKPDDSLMWDASARVFVSRPAKILVDRVDDIVNDPTITPALGRLNAQQLQAVRDVLARVLGTRRFRPQAGRVEL